MYNIIKRQQPYSNLWIVQVLKGTEVVKEFIDLKDEAVKQAKSWIKEQQRETDNVD